MPAKFRIGEKVRLTNHEVAIITGKATRHKYKNILYTPNPENLKLIDRNRPRRIAKIVYSKRRKRNLYYLSSYGQLASISFDSTQLTSEPPPSPGRPRKKRKYHRKRQYHHIKHRKLNVNPPIATLQ